MGLAMASTVQNIEESGNSPSELMMGDMSKKPDHTLDNILQIANHSKDILFRFHKQPSPGFDYISPAVTAITGYSPDEYYQRPMLFEQIVELENLDLLNQINLPADSPLGPHVIRIVNKDGSKRWLELLVTPIYDDHGQIIVIEGTAREITNQKRYEKDDLVKSQALLASIIASAMDAIIVLDSERRIVLFNDAAVGMFGRGTGWGIRHTATRTTSTTCRASTMRLRGCGCCMCYTPASRFPRWP